MSLTSTTSENTKTVTSSPADIHGLNQTTTTQTKAAQRVSSKELWESTNVRTNNVFSNYSVPNDVAVSNSTLIDDTIFGNEKRCGDDSKINGSKCESSRLNVRCENEKNIIFSTRSWNIARRINDLFRKRRSQTGKTSSMYSFFRFQVIVPIETVLFARTKVLKLLFTFLSIELLN